MSKLSVAEVRSIAARLLDDMCANHQMFKTYDEHDIEEVTIALCEMLSDVCVAEEWTPDAGRGSK